MCWLFAADRLDDYVSISSEKFSYVIREQRWIDRQASLSCDVANEDADELDSNTMTGSLSTRDCARRAARVRNASKYFTRPPSTRRTGLFDTPD